METIEEIKTISPDPQLIEITKRVMDQNDEIIKMNSRVMALLTSPLLLVKSRPDREGGHHV